MQLSGKVRLAKDREEWKMASDELKIVLEDVKEKFDPVIEAVNRVRETLERHKEEIQRDHEELKNEIIFRRKDLNEHRDSTEVHVGRKRKKA
jgi:hypothetical protein